MESGVNCVKSCYSLEGTGHWIQHMQVICNLDRLTFIGCRGGSMTGEGPGETSGQALNQGEYQSSLEEFFCKGKQKMEQWLEEHEESILGFVREMGRT